MLVLGGPDVGKSLVLENLARTLNVGGEHVAVIVDGRATSDKLAEGIIAAVQDADGAAFTALKKAFARFPAFSHYVKGVGDDFTQPPAPPPVLKDVLELFSTSCKDENKRAIVLIDEANLALPSLLNNGDAKLTKQQKIDQVSVCVYVARVEADAWRRSLCRREERVS